MGFHHFYSVACRVSWGPTLFWLCLWRLPRQELRRRAYRFTNISPTWLAIAKWCASFTTVELQILTIMWAHTLSCRGIQRVLWHSLIRCAVSFVSSSPFYAGPGTRRSTLRKSTLAPCSRFGSSSCQGCVPISCACVLVIRVFPRFGNGTPSRRLAVSDVRCCHSAAPLTQWLLPPICIREPCPSITSRHTCEHSTVSAELAFHTFAHGLGISGSLALVLRSAIT